MNGISREYPGTSFHLQLQNMGFDFCLLEYLENIPSYCRHNLKLCEVFETLLSEWRSQLSGSHFSELGVNLLDMFPDE